MGLFIKLIGYLQNKTIPYPLRNRFIQKKEKQRCQRLLNLKEQVSEESHETCKRNTVLGESQKLGHGGFQSRDHLKISPMEDRELRTLLLHKVGAFQARNLELVHYPLLLFSVSTNSFLVCLVLGLILFCWLIRHFSIEKNRYLYIRLFPEQSRLSKEQPPLARFVLRISSSGNGRQPYISPGMLNLLYIHASLTFSSSPTMIMNLYVSKVTIVLLNYQSKTCLCGRISHS